jgi:hypothetical protein
MSTFRARFTVEDGTLTVSRPLLAPEPVADVIDTVLYRVTDAETAGRLSSVELVMETPDETGTPIGDGIASTTSGPLDVEASTFDGGNAQVTR